MIAEAIDELRADATGGRLSDPLEATRADPLRDPLVDPLSEADGDAVQCAGDRATAVKSAANQGVKGSGGPLPHLGEIQKAFGKHSVSGVKAYTDEKAKQANAQMGSKAYAKGDKVALGEGGDDLRIVAHEATHIIQQRAGIKPAGGVGSPGDPLEQQADAVADEVVQGKSVESMLDRFIGD